MVQEKIVKPKFPIKLKWEVMDGKPVVTPAQKDWTSEQKEAVKQYNKDLRVYKNLKSGKQRLFDRIEKLKETIKELKKRLRENKLSESKRRKETKEKRVQIRKEYKKRLAEIK